MRINKLLSNYGYCSRKEANRLIEEERVYVNGELCTTGKWVEKEDFITLDGEEVREKKKIYLAFNKPRGIVCTAAKEKENNIIDFINYGEYIFPVGRLDKDSEGLILLTNDGDFADKIISSEYYHEKEYIVKVDKIITEKFIYNMQIGVEILGQVTRACIVNKVDDYTFKIILTQGLNRQIRRMCLSLGYKVLELKRIRIINIELENLISGEYKHVKEITIKEIITLNSM